MWIMHPRGFYSAVQHRDNPDTIMVRARVKGDLDNLRDLLPNSKPYRTQKGDYLWRLECTVAEWMAATATMASEVDYPNFKNAVKSDAHHDVYLSVWAVLRRLENWKPWPSKKVTAPKPKKSKAKTKAKPKKSKAKTKAKPKNRKAGERTRPKARSK